MVVAGAAALSQAQSPQPLPAGDGVRYGAVDENGQLLGSELGAYEIVDLVPNPDGTDLIVTAEPNQVLTIYASDDMKNWQLVSTAAEIEPGVYSALDEQAQGKRRRFYIIVRPRGPKPCNPQVHAQNLEASVANFEFLTDGPGGQKQELKDAAERVSVAYWNFNQKSNELGDLTRRLADCLKNAMRLRLAAQMAEHEAVMAEDRVRDLERELVEAQADLNDAMGQLPDAEADLAAKEANLQGWRNALAVEQAALAAATTDEERAHLAGVIAVYQGAITRREGFVAEAQAKVDSLNAKMTDARDRMNNAASQIDAVRADAASKRAAAEAAWAAYDRAKKVCKVLKVYRDAKQQEVEEARDELKDASKAFGEEKIEKTQQGAENRQAAEARASAEEKERIAEAERRERERVERQFNEVKKFFEDVKGISGESAALDLVRKILGASAQGLDWAKPAVDGTIEWLVGGTLDGLSSAGLSALQLGYGILVAIAGDVAGEAVARLARRRGAEAAAKSWLASLKENPKPGDFKHANDESKNPDGSIKTKVRNTYLMVANADGSVTVYSHSKEANGAGGGLEVFVVKP